MNGRGTYVRANKDYFTAWSDSADKANQKAKAFKATILGFDEINALNDNSATGSGSGSAINYNDMFEEAEIDMEVVNRVKEIYDYAVKIAGVLATLYIAKEAVSFFTMLYNMGIFGKAAATVVTIGIQFKLIQSSIADAINGKDVLKNQITAAVTAAIGTGVLTALWGPAGLIIGVAVSLAALISSVKAAKELEWKDTPLYKDIMRLKNEIEEPLNIVKEINVNIDARQSGITDILTKTQTAIGLINEIYDLAGKASKDEGDIAKLKVLIGSLNTLGFGDLIGDFDELTGEIGDSKKAVTDLLNEMLKLQLMSAGSAALADTLVDQQKAQSAADQAYENAETAAQDLAAILYRGGLSPEDIQKIFGAIEKYGGLTADAMVELGYANKGVIDGMLTMKGAFADDSGLFKAAKEASEVYVTAAGNYSDAQKTVANLANDVNYYTQLAAGNFALEMDESGTVALAVFGNIKTAAGEAADAVAGDDESSLLKRWQSFVGEFVSFDGTTATVTVDANAEPFKQTMADTFTEVFGAFPQSANELFNGIWGHFFGVHGGFGGSFATGGFPEDGLFFANSGEMVGKFSNGKTAVANNAEIVEGIASGVRRAMSDFDGGDITVQIINPDGSVANETTITSAERRNRRAGATVIPVGV